MDCRLQWGLRFVGAQRSNLERQEVVVEEGETCSQYNSRATVTDNDK